MELDEYLEKLYNAADWTMIPEYYAGSLKDWIEHGWLPGTFLQTMLRHNLADVLRHEESKDYQLAQWVIFLDKYVPRQCHGSEEIVRDWAARGGFRGKPINERRETCF